MGRRMSDHQWPQAIDRETKREPRGSRVRLTAEEREWLRKDREERERKGAPRVREP